MKFEWDSVKAAGTEKKHGIDFHEAATIFADPLAITFDDPDHSDDESRELTFGISCFQKHLIVSHTNRNSVIRIISARLMTKNERKIYEEG